MNFGDSNTKMPYFPIDMYAALTENSSMSGSNSYKKFFEF
jgi:hypothetical protein